MTYPEYESFIQEAMGYLTSRNEGAKARYGIGVLARFEYDLYRGEIWWSDTDGPKIRGKVTIVGSTSTKTGTWLWSWANSHFRGLNLGDIDRVREFGEREHISKLTDEKWTADDVDGWEMAALSAKLLEAQGAYRAPSEKGALFLLYDHLEQIPSQEIHQYLPRPRLDWPFSDPPNVMTFTVRAVMDGRAPILLVCHDESDGGWQFLTGGPMPTQDEWMLVALSEIVARDPSIRELADLPTGYSAMRNSTTENWVRYKSPPEE